MRRARARDRFSSSATAPSSSLSLSSPSPRFPLYRGCRSHLRQPQQTQKIWQTHVKKQTGIVKSTTTLDAGTACRQIICLVDYATAVEVCLCFWKRSSCHTRYPGGLLLHLLVAGGHALPSFGIPGVCVLGNARPSCWLP